MLSFPIVSAATAWNGPQTRLTWLLIINEGLSYGNKLDHSLLNPNQLRYHGIKYSDNPFDKSQSLGIPYGDVVTIPSRTKGTKIIFESRVPTLEESNNFPDSQRVQLTSLHPWNPHSVQLSEMETTNRLVMDDRDAEEEISEYAEGSNNYLMASTHESLCIFNQPMSTVNVNSKSLKRKQTQQ